MLHVDDRRNDLKVVLNPMMGLLHRTSQAYIERFDLGLPFTQRLFRLRKCLAHRLAKKVVLIHDRRRVISGSSLAVLIMANISGSFLMFIDRIPALPT